MKFSESDQSVQIQEVKGTRSHKEDHSLQLFSVGAYNSLTKASSERRMQQIRI